MLNDKARCFIEMRFVFVPKDEHQIGHAATSDAPHQNLKTEQWSLPTGKFDESVAYSHEAGPCANLEW